MSLPRPWPSATNAIVRAAEATWVGRKSGLILASHSCGGLDRRPGTKGAAGPRTVFFRGLPILGIFAQATLNNWAGGLLGLSCGYRCSTRERCDDPAHNLRGHGFSLPADGVSFKVPPAH